MIDEEKIKERVWLLNSNPQLKPIFDMADELQEKNRQRHEEQIQILNAIHDSLENIFARIVRST